jgi:DNA-binding transcriptional ArsR family regulator
VPARVGRGFLDGVTSTIRDPAMMRAMAHPARLALVEHLANHPDGATATECAAVVGLSPSATSYHLRALAKVGIIHEAPGRGDGRERVWRAAHESWEIANDPQASPEQVAAENALVETFLARQDDKVHRFLAGARQESPDWYQASLISERQLLLTAVELKRLNAEIDKLVEPYRHRSRERPPRASRAVSFQLRVVPIDSPGENSLGLAP